MHPRLRRSLIGACAGLAAGSALAASIESGSSFVVLGAAVGAAFALVYRPAERALADSVAESAALAVPLWALVDVIVLPLAREGRPSWTAEEMQSRFPLLAGWVLLQVAIGALVKLVDSALTRWIGPERASAAPAPVAPQHVVVLGGGFAGVTAAAELEKRFGADARIEITLISETNALLFTPMLAEVSASSLEATHISPPLRTSLRRTNVVRGRVAGIDLAARRVELEAEDGASSPPIPYDHVVIALGAVSNYLGLENVRREAFDFKSLADAISIRNHVIDCFERADRETDGARRRALLTIVVAGGGFAGAELAGGLNDFARGMLAYYPRIPRDEVRIVVVHGGKRILNELSEGLALYAQDRMRARGVTFELETRVKDARRGAVILSSGEIATETLVWTAGTAPNPILAQLPVERDKRGAVVVSRTLEVPGHENAWAIGDSAAIPDANTGKNCPPTAQFAIREARHLARNVQARIAGGAITEFSFEPLGALCVVGHHTACAEIKGLRFSGLFAWLLWRGIYLSKLPTLERKVRVLVDWTIEVFFPRDIVQTIDLDARSRGAKGRAP